MAICSYLTQKYPVFNLTSFLFKIQLVPTYSKFYFANQRKVNLIREPIVFFKTTYTTHYTKLIQVNYVTYLDNS